MPFYGNPLFAQLHPDLLHLPVTVKSVRVMRLKNLLNLLPTGCFKGYNLATVIMMFSVRKDGFCAFVPCLSTHFGSETSPRPHTRFDSQMRVQERTRRPCHRRSRRVSPFIDVRVGDCCLRSTTVARIVRRACLTEVLYGYTSCDATSLRHCFPPAVLSEWSFRKLTLLRRTSVNSVRACGSWRVDRPCHV